MTPEQEANQVYIREAETCLADAREKRIDAVKKLRTAKSEIDRLSYLALKEYAEDEIKECLETLRTLKMIHDPQPARIP